MSSIDWKSTPQDEVVHRERLMILKKLGSSEVLEFFKQDPRDEVLGYLLYLHPEPLCEYSQIDAGGFWGPLQQIIIAELSDFGFVSIDSHNNVELTHIGLKFGEARLEKEPSWDDYYLRSGAPQYPKMTRQITIALKALLLHEGVKITHWIKDVQTD